jgi:sulfate permease, SulP family
MSAASVLRRERPSRRIQVGDLVAGVSVAFIVVPQGLAYAELAGLPSYVGLYAAAFPPLLAAFFASSRYLQTGPVAMTALLSFGALSEMATPGSPEYVRLALLLAVVVGVVRLGLGLTHGGAITHYMSHPVVLGFTTGAVFLIIASQAAVAFGVDGAPEDLLPRLWAVVSAPGSWNSHAVLLSAGVAAIIITSRRIHPLVPGVLIAVLVGLAVGGLTDYGASLVGEVEAGLPPFSLSLPWGDLPQLIVPGIIIAGVGFAEPTAIARTLAAQDRERWDPSRELVSQGVANIAAGLTGGFPVGGSFSRSSVNKLAGARSRWSGAVTGLAVLAFTPFAGVLSSLPRAVLGAIVITAVVRLVRIPDMIRLIKVTWGQSVIAWVTFAATLVLSPRIDLAVLVGVGLAALVHLYREASRLVVRTEFEPPVLRVTPVGVLFYGSAPVLADALNEKLAEHPDADEVRLNLERLGRIDHSGMMALQDFAEEVRAAGLAISVERVPRVFTGIWDRMGGLGPERRATPRAGT